jgi:hypothetical protein
MSRAPSTFRKQDVTRLLSAMAAAGQQVRCVELDKGKVVFVIDDARINLSGEAPINPGDEWDIR